MKSLFERALGSAFAKMPGSVRELHRPHGTTSFAGTAQIDGAANVLGAAAARLFRFPGAGSDVPVEVTIEPRVAEEIWRRRFGRAEFFSALAIDDTTGQLTERFGPVRCTLDVECRADGLDMRIEGARWLGIPLPRLLTPWTRACERIDGDGRFTFDVEIGLPGIGRLVRYRGWLRQRAKADR
jgi:hypothetical protein